MALKYSCYEPFPEYAEVEGVNVRFSLPYDRVLKFYDLFSENGGILTNAEKLEAVYEWFVISPVKHVSPEFKVKAVDKIIGEYTRLHERKRTSTEKLYDFSADSSYIFASFMYAYRIDLFEEQGKMPWWKFIALFEGLPDDSKIKQIIEIRARPFPESRPGNQKMINQLAELKQIYALPVSREEREKTAQNGWNKLFDMMLNKGR